MLYGVSRTSERNLLPVTERLCLAKRVRVTSRFPTPFQALPLHDFYVTFMRPLYDLYATFMQLSHGYSTKIYYHSVADHYVRDYKLSTN